MTLRGPRARLAAVAAVLLAAGGGVALAGYGHRPAGVPPVAGTPAAGTPAAGAGSAGSAAGVGTAAGGPPARLLVYYVRPLRGVDYLAPERHPVGVRVATARAAVEELLDGRPIYPGSTRPFPAGTRLLGLRVRAGTATVDLSRQALGGRPGGGYGQCSVQALVWTLTGVRGVRRVLLEVEGRTSGWIDGHDLASAWGGRNRPGRRLAPDRGARVAPIVLTGPLPGGLVSGDRIVVTGDASVRDGTVGLRLRDQQGAVVAQTVSTAALPAPARGAFAGALVFPPPPRPERWTVEAFAASPTDGSVLYAVTVPVTVAAPARSPATGTPAAGTPAAPATSTSVAPG